MVVAKKIKIERKIMMTDKNKTATAISLIALIIALGVPVGSQTFGEVFSNELKDYYHCSIDGEIQEFLGGISGTSYSGYPYTDSRAGAKRCGTSDLKGEWILLSTWAESNGVDPYELLSIYQESSEPETEKSTPSGDVWGKSYLCSYNKPCIEIKQ